MLKDEAYLLDMRLAAQKALRFTAGVDWPRFSSDELIQYAVLHAIQIVGEAAFKISPEFKASHPEMPWASITGMRHRLVHDYTRVDLPTVWRVVEVYLPEMLKLIAPLVPPEIPPGAAPADPPPDDARKEQ